MLLLLAPSKTQSLHVRSYPETSHVQFNDLTGKLLQLLKSFSPNELGKLMKMSKKLADQNHQRYQDFPGDYTLNNSKQALFVFKGDVYDYIDTDNYDQKLLTFAQNNLIILSGLYGALRPLDLISPYRLEMGLKLRVDECKNLYEFWRSTITDKVVELCEPEQTIINLASVEYFKVLNTKLITTPIITPQFKEEYPEKLKSVAIYAKRARGSMADFIIKEMITDHEKIKEFSSEGYKFREDLSTDFEYIYTRAGK